MNSISNKTIMVLLIMAMIITVVSTVVSIQKLTNLQFQQQLLTGAGILTNATGTTAIQVIANTAITNNIVLLNWSTGFVNWSCLECRTTTQGGHTGYCCNNWTNITWGFLLENTGNANVSVNYVCVGNCTAGSFLGGTRPMFQIKFTNNTASGRNENNESGPQDTLGSCNSELNNTYINVTAAGTFFCGNATTNYSLSPNDSMDAIAIDFNLTIPNDARTGVTGNEKISTAIFTFNASAAG